MLTSNGPRAKLFLALGVLVSGWLLLSGCVGLPAPQVMAAPAPPSAPNEAVDMRSDTPSRLPVAAPSTCPVTRSPDPPFTPPAPYPSQPPDKTVFWYGTNALWTLVPVNGQWQQLLYGEKVFWWSEEYDLMQEPQPALTVTGRRLDGPAPTFQVSGGTNAFHPSFGTAMLTGVKVPTPGCWEITGRYRKHTLSFVVQVTPRTRE